MTTLARFRTWVDPSRLVGRLDRLRQWLHADTLWGPTRWPYLVAGLLGLIGACLIVQPALNAVTETREDIQIMRRDLATRFAGAPDWLDQTAEARGQVGQPQFYRLPVGETPEVEAHARTSLVMAQALELVKATGGTVMNVGVDAPQRLAGTIRVPGHLIVEGDFVGLRHWLAAIRSVSPNVAWHRCRLTPLGDADGIDPLAKPRHLLRVELALTCNFEVADGGR